MGLFDSPADGANHPGNDAGRIPPGQKAASKWPVLTYGETPSISTADWRLEVSGLVEHPITLDWAGLTALPLTRIRCDLHCVTRWSRLDVELEGVRVREILGAARPHASARFVMAHAHGGYSTNLPLEVLREDDALLAFRHDGRPLEAEHGGPCRLLVPRLYLWKSAKWVSGLELMDRDKPGFWERGGYHMNGDPWNEERYGWTW